MTKVKDARTILLKRYEEPSEDKPLIKRANLFLLFGLVMLVPASLLAVAAPAQGTVQGAASVFVAGPDGVTKNMELKATKDNEGVKPVEGFALKADNVVSTPLNGEITVFADVGVEFMGAKLTPAANPQNTFDIPIVGGQISFVGMYAGVYTLDVIIGDSAYECIVVVGTNPQTAIINQITEINTQSSNVVKVFEKGKVKKILDKEEICRFTPQHPACAPDPETGECPDGFNMNEDGQCFPSGSCPDGYHRANDDETGACISEEDLKQCNDGSWAHPGDFCREEEPPIECPEGTIPDPESEGRCIEPPADFKACPDMVDNPDCKLDEEPTTCEEGFVLENGACAALDSNCGGEPCTASDKENSTTSDPVEGTSEPEEPDDELVDEDDIDPDQVPQEEEESDEGSDTSSQDE